MSELNPNERNLLKQVLSRSEECASLVQLERLDQTGAHLWEHIASCTTCQVEWALLSSFESAAPLPHERRQVRWIVNRLQRQTAQGASGQQRRPSARRRSGFQPLKQAGLALSAGLAAAAIVLSLGEGQKPTLNEPTRAEETALRSGELFSLSPEGDVDAPPSELRWQAVPGASVYALRLMEADRADLWTTQTRGLRAPVPSDVLARMLPGKPLLWQVTALDAEGNIVAESVEQRLRVRRVR